MRVVWRGTISFGLVTIPVALYLATESKNIPSRQIHVNDGGRVQYKRVCSIDGAEVPFEEIGRGYESTTGELVVLSDVDLAALPAKTSRSIEIVSFLPTTAVDPIYFDRSYYVEPEKQGAKAYRLMRDALRKMGRIALAKVRLRDREILSVLRVQGDLLPHPGARHGGGPDRLAGRREARPRPLPGRPPGDPDRPDRCQGDRSWSRSRGRFGSGAA
jgi:DNA end-binding protein Ku